MHAPKRRPAWRFWAIIAVMVAVWGTAMLLRWEIRTRWWAHRLGTAATATERAEYAARLAAVGERAVPAVEHLLTHHDPDVRLQVVLIARSYRGEPSRRVLLTALNDAAPEVRDAAAIGLALLGDAAATAALIDILNGRDEGAAVSAAAALQRVDAPDAIRALRDAARGIAGGERLPVRAQAMDSLGLIGDVAAVPMLIEALTDERPLTSPPASDRLLQRVLGSSSVDWRRLGIDPTSAPTVAVPETVAEVAARALERIAGESFGYRLADPPDRKAAVVRMYRQWWETHRAASSEPRPEGSG